MMNLLASQPMELPPAPANPLLRSISDALNTGPGTGEYVALGVGVVGFIVLLLVAARYLNREAPREEEPQIDFLTLAVDLLGLSEEDRRDLQRIARATTMDPAAAMLLSPANLAQAASPLLKAGPDKGFRKRLDALSMRLFDSPLPME